MICIICINCLSIHRSLGVKFQKYELKSLLKQNKINRILELKLIDGNEKTKFISSREDKEKFFVNKYIEKKYFNNDEKYIIKDIFKPIENN